MLVKWQSSPYPHGGRKAHLFSSRVIVELPTRLGRDSTPKVHHGGTAGSSPDPNTRQQSSCRGVCVCVTQSERESELFDMSNTVIVEDGGGGFSNQLPRLFPSIVSPSSPSPSVSHTGLPAAPRALCHPSGLSALHTPWLYLEWPLSLPLQGVNPFFHCRVITSPEWLPQAPTLDSLTPLSYGTRGLLFLALPGLDFVSHLCGRITDVCLLARLLGPLGL